MACSGVQAARAWLRVLLLLWVTVQTVMDLLTELRWSLLPGWLGLEEARARDAAAAAGEDYW